ncbi:MAG: type I glyceraldehyde-3-phosphate dehydrogenase [Nanobdellota archaeon]
MEKVAINGFGRIGRLVFRAMMEKNINVLAVNDLTDTKTLAHLLKHDSVHGKFPGKVDYDENNLYVDGKTIKVLSEKDPKNLPWEDLGVEVVIESTGIFRERNQCAMHLEAGAKKVILSAPAKDELDMTIVKGVNEDQYNPEKHHIVSNASCTTNCLAPLVKVLNDNFGIEKGFMTTIHSYTADQKLVDAPHKDLRRARSAAINMIPTTTGAAIAVTKVIPELQGKMDGIAVRVPTTDGSVTDFVCELKKDATSEEINDIMKSVSSNELKGIIDYLDYPAVSSDIVGNPASSIFDPEYTNIKGKMLKIISWYDNEWGYSNRIAELVGML